jgi:hypothetical protein
MQGIFGPAEGDEPPLGATCALILSSSGARDNKRLEWLRFSRSIRENPVYRG